MPVTLLSKNQRHSRTYNNIPVKQNFNFILISPFPQKNTDSAFHQGSHNTPGSITIKNDDPQARDTDARGSANNVKSN